MLEASQQHFEEHGYTRLDDFLIPEHYHALYTKIQSEHQEGEFKVASVGRQFNPQETIRKNDLQWLDHTSPHASLTYYREQMQALMRAFNRTFYLGLVDYEAHFSVYKPGDFYKKHVDQFQGSNERRLSCVYYLNPVWALGDGGELVLYDDDHRELNTIQPKGNRLVCFRSDLLHQVLVTQKIRYSITGWMKVRS